MNEKQFDLLLKALARDFARAKEGPVPGPRGPLTPAEREERFQRTVAAARVRLAARDRGTRARSN